MSIEYMVYQEERDEIDSFTDDEREEAYLRGIKEADFQDKAKILIDKVIGIEEALLQEGAASPVEIDDILDDSIDLEDEVDEDNPEPIRCFVKGRVTDGLVEIPFASIVYGEDKVRVFTLDEEADTFDLREKAAQIVEEHLIDFLD